MLLALNQPTNPILCSCSFLMFPKKTICWELSEQSYKEHPYTPEEEQLAGLCTHLPSLVR